MRGDAGRGIEAKTGKETMKTTHKTPSSEALKAAEEIQRLARECESLLANGGLALIIDRHFAGLWEVKEAAEKLSQRIDMWKRGVAEGVEVVVLNNELRSALSAVEKGKVGE